MRLLYITNGITGIGGLERVLSIKLSYFTDTLGYDVHVVTLNESQSHPFYTFSSKIQVHNINTPKNSVSYLISYIRGINDVVKQVSPDLISVCDDGLKGLYIPLWIHKRYQSIIYERHASLRLNNSKVQSFLIKLGGCLFDRVILLTAYNRTEWISNNLEVIPNPLSFPVDEKSALTHKRIICVGSLSHNKGYDLLIKAWGKIASRYPDWKISIYGRGDSSVYAPMLRDAKVSDSITFCGPTTEIKQKMLESSFLVLPSRSEGFGMVLIEAMACGLPCVSYDCPCGPRDIVQNGKNGFLIPPQDTDALAAGIEKLIQDHSLLQKMSENAIKSVSPYQISHVASKWASLFNQLIKRN